MWYVLPASFNRRWLFCRCCVNGLLVFGALYYFRLYLIVATSPIFVFFDRYCDHYLFKFRNDRIEHFIFCVSDRFSFCKPSKVCPWYRLSAHPHPNIFRSSSSKSCNRECGFPRPSIPFKMHALYFWRHPSLPYVLTVNSFFHFDAGVPAFLPNVMALQYTIVWSHRPSIPRWWSILSFRFSSGRYLQLVWLSTHFLLRRLLDLFEYY